MELLWYVVQMFVICPVFAIGLYVVNMMLHLLYIGARGVLNTVCEEFKALVLFALYGVFFKILCVGLVVIFRAFGRSFFRNLQSDLIVDIIGKWSAAADRVWSGFLDSSVVSFVEGFFFKLRSRAKKKFSWRLVYKRSTVVGYALRLVSKKTRTSIRAFVRFAAIYLARLVLNFGLIAFYLTSSILFFFNSVRNKPTGVYSVGFWSTLFLSLFTFRGKGDAGARRALLIVFAFKVLSLREALSGAWLFIQRQIVRFTPKHRAIFPSSKFSLKAPTMKTIGWGHRLKVPLNWFRLSSKRGRKSGSFFLNAVEELFFSAFEFVKSGLGKKWINMVETAQLSRTMGRYKWQLGPLLAPTNTANDAPTSISPGHSPGAKNTSISTYDQATKKHGKNN